MGINRAPFNALVDDTGNGLTGSIWNKAAIQNVLLDPIDANPAWQDVPFSAANFGALAPMTWTVGAAAVIRNRYAVVGRILYWSFYISWYSGANVLGGSPSTTIHMFLPPGFAPAGAQTVPIAYTIATGVPVVCGMSASNSGTAMLITKSTGGNFTLSDAPGLVGTVIFEV